MGDCVLCRSHSTVEYRTYYGHTIKSGKSWITGGRCWHADGGMTAGTLAELKRKIKALVRDRL